MSISNASNKNIHSIPKKTPIYDRLIRKKQDLTLKQMKEKIRRCDSKTKRNQSLSQKLTQCLSDSTLSAKDFILKSTEQNKSIHQQRIISDTPFRKFKISGWIDQSCTSLLDWNFQDLICAAHNQFLTFYNKFFDEETEKEALVNHEIAIQDRVSAIKFSPKKPNIAIGYQSGWFGIYDYHQLKFDYVNDLHQEKIADLDWSDRLLVTASLDDSCNVLDLRKNYSAIKFKPIHQISRAKISGSLIATGGMGSHVYIFDIRKPSDYVGKYEQRSVESLAWIHDKNILVSGGGVLDRKMKFWDYSKGKIIKQIETRTQICSITVSKNTQQIVSCQGFSSNQIIVWNINGKKEKTLQGGHSKRVQYSALSPSGIYLASGAADKKLLLWKLFSEDEKKEELLKKIDLR